jgi:hypothetical protein
LAERRIFILYNNILDIGDGNALTERSFVTVHPEVEGGAYELALQDGECLDALLEAVGRFEVDMLVQGIATVRCEW